jgi:hypothetical protein
MRKAIQDSVQEERPPEALQTVAPESDFLEEGKFFLLNRIFLTSLFSY